MGRMPPIPQGHASSTVRLMSCLGGFDVMASLPTVALRAAAYGFRLLFPLPTSAAAPAPKTGPATGARPAADSARAAVKPDSKAEPNKIKAPPPIDPQKLAQSVTI